MEPLLEGLEKTSYREGNTRVKVFGKGFKKSDILNEAKIPVSERAAVPVVRTGPACSIVWVAGVRADDRFKCTAATRYAVKIVLKRME